jgi:hypothetical protein
MTTPLPEHLALAQPMPRDVAENALCSQLDAELWFPAKGAAVEVARGRTCPALEACRAWAIGEAALTHGIFGGLTARERQAVRNGRPIPDPNVCGNGHDRRLGKPRADSRCDQCVKEKQRRADERRKAERAARKAAEKGVAA